MNIGKFLGSLFKKSGTAPIRPFRPNQDFFLGANLPWITYGCDFGANAWRPDGGISQPAQREMLTNYFRELSKSDIRVVRWFMFCDGRAGLHFDRENVSLDSYVFPDADAALEIAGHFGIRIMFVLFDFHWFFPAKSKGNVQMGGRGKYITDTGLRLRLLENVVQPILHRYGQHPAIHSWDVFNEPEWVLLGIGSVNPMASTSLRKFRSFVEDVVNLIHNETAHPATLGLAWRSSLSRFEDCLLDFEQVHWYDIQGDALWTLLERQTPVILGEFPTSGSRFEVAEILRHAHHAGFAGALAWSARDTVTLSSFASFVAGLTQFRENTLAAPSASDNA